MFPIKFPIYNTDHSATQYYSR